MMPTNNNQDRFDRFVNEEIEKINYPYQSAAWNGLQDMLDQHDAQSSTKDSSSLFDQIKWWFAMVAFILVLGTVLVILNLYSPFQNSQAPTQPQEMNQPVEVTPENEAVSIEDSGNGIETTSNQSGSNSSVQRRGFLDIPTLKIQSVTLLEVPSHELDAEIMQDYSGETVRQRIRQIQEEKRKKYMVW